jgi:hypothetical protein
MKGGIKDKMTKEKIVYSGLNCNTGKKVELSQEELAHIKEYLEKESGEKEDEIRLNKGILEAFHLFKFLSRFGQDDKQKFLKYISKLLDRTEKRSKLLEELNKEQY